MLPAVVPRASLAVTTSVPALIVVDPLYVFANDNVQVPFPDLVNAEVPEVAGAEYAAVDNVPFPVPVKVKVGDVDADGVIPPVKVNVPEPEASIDPPDDPNVILRLDESPEPVYFNVPPLIVILPEAAAPKLLLEPPFAIVPTLIVPALIVVTPV